MSEIRVRAKYVCVEHASARGVAERWRSMYERDGVWTNNARGSTSDIYNRLCALGETPDIAKVAEIIGNKSWSYLSCDGCSEHVTTMVRIGDHRYADESKSYCATCIKEAAAVLADTE
jgi:hypothetical protein